MKTTCMPCDSCAAETVVCFTQDDAELSVEPESGWKVFWIEDEDAQYPRLAFRCPDCLERSGKR